MRQVQHFINGALVAGAGKRKGDIYNPNTGEIQAQVDLADASVLQQAIDAAAAAQPEWAAVNPQRRARVMFKLKELVEAALERNAPRALAVVSEVFSYGGDIKQFSHDLVHYLRDIIMLRVAGSKTTLTDLSDQETQTLSGLGEHRDIADLQRLFSVAAATAARCVTLYGTVAVEMGTHVNDVTQRIEGACELESHRTAVEAGRRGWGDFPTERSRLSRVVS